MYYTRDRIIKYAVLAAAVFLLYLLEALVLRRVRLFGVAPMVMPAAVAVLALFEGPVVAGVVGYSAGLAIDMLSVHFPVFHSIAFMLCGVVTGVVCRYLFKRSLLSACLWGLFSLLFVSLSRYLIFFLVPGKAGLSAVYSVCVPEVLCSILFLPLWYLMFRGFSRRFSREED